MKERNRKCPITQARRRKPTASLTLLSMKRQHGVRTSPVKPLGAKKSDRRVRTMGDPGLWFEV